MTEVTGMIVDWFLDVSKQFSELLFSVGAQTASQKTS